MVSLVFRFPGRRYHATPPGHHVNEGHIEWPPSPWRILRALVATGYTKLGWNDVPDDARGLLQKLASTLPVYLVPPVSAAHSRHYMPLGRLDKGREKTTLVFDTWAEVGDGELVVQWNAQLSEHESALLRTLVPLISYLGRAESWVAATVESGAQRSSGLRVSPCESSERPGVEWEQVPLLAPEPPEQYLQWRASRVAEIEAGTSATPAKKKPAARKKAPVRSDPAGAAYPADLVQCLQVDTTWLELHGWTQPPGTQRALYWRPRDAVESGAPRLHPPTSAVDPVEAMLLSLATPSGNMHALPTLYRTLPQAELIHRALVSHVSRGNDAHNECIVGRTEDGAPLRGHRHAHLLPLDLDGDGHLDHIIVWASMGLDGAAQNAVRALRRTYTKGGVGELRVLLAGSGTLAQMRGTPGMIGDGLRMAIGPAGGARVWVTQTPFVPPRHVKVRGASTLAGQILAELQSRGLPEPTLSTPVDLQSDEARPLRHFVRVRRNGPAPPVDAGFAWRLEFDSPVEGPIALGYGSHFGLGRFAAIR